jgi:hypothetical protein
VQIYGPATQVQLLGVAVVKLAPRRMAMLTVTMAAGTTCAAADNLSSYYGPIEHMLRTARFHLRLKAYR